MKSAEFCGKLIQEYRLDWASRSYRIAAAHVEELVIEDPLHTATTFGDLGG